MDKISDNLYKTFVYDDRYKYILEGLGNTLIIAFFAVIIGVILGIIVSLVRNNYEVNGKGKISNFIANSYVIFKSSDVNILIVGILAFGINSGAYVSEIIRSGINAIDKGQLEAGLALGLSYAKVMRLVIMPQAIKNILPALGNEFITLLKETSVGAYIGILELTKASDIIASRTYDYFFPLIVIALIYLALTYFLSKLVNLLERKIGNARS